MDRLPKRKPKIDELEAYKIALQTRNFEISLFWQRSNYFLALNVALALGFFRLIESPYSFALASLGGLVSFLWFQVNLGSKFWQSRWEERLKKQELKFTPNLHFFAASKETIESDVSDSLGGVFPATTWFKRWVNRQISKKPSVSDNMLKLSMVFMFGWVIMLIIKIVFE
ncbi:hypothetical protein [Shewanella sp. WPAGA9]|uniref:RipA family octameric membrane protein n=1 Tax=Shewanella sp. ENK2 TaxID=2775245 RepID=UPI001783FE62|nr:hypothetical protein [Shewanella sp. WPAGA9]